MHHLLVAFDGSPSAMNALQYAIKLARETKAVTLHLVTVSEDPDDLKVFVSDQEAAAIRQEGGRKTIEPAADAAKSAGVPFSTDILGGQVAQAIVKRAGELGCDGIVIGTRGTGAIKNLVMGSIATKVVHLSKLPVTLVH